MLRLLFFVNRLLTLPFGVASRVVAVEVFARFGIQLDPGGALVASGDAAGIAAVSRLARTPDCTRTS